WGCLRAFFHSKLTLQMPPATICQGFLQPRFDTASTEIFLMPSFKQLAILGLGTALLAGCGDGNPDSQARDKMNEGRIAALKGDEMSIRQAETDLQSAATVSGVSTATSGQAHAVLGQVKYDAGLEILREADRKELA